MRRDADIELFPPGTLVRTPSGRVGIVQKSQGAESKRDHFMRVCIWWGPGPRDGVVLQPHLLTRIDFITEDQDRS